MRKRALGEDINYESEKKSLRGYLAVPPQEGKAPGIIVIQEWWGLVPHIKDVTDRLASTGYVAFAPDLYGGKTTAEPDEASKLMLELSIDTAIEDMLVAIDFLKRHPNVLEESLGCVGFCMGGALSIQLAAAYPVKAAVTYYGIPYRKEPDYSAIQGSIQGHFAEDDQWASWEKAQELDRKLRSAGVDTEMYLYEGTSHGFFNDSRPEVYRPEAARLAWDRTIDFFRRKLGGSG